MKFLQDKLHSVQTIQTSQIDKTMQSMQTMQTIQTSPLFNKNYINNENVTTFKNKKPLNKINQPPGYQNNTSPNIPNYNKNDYSHTNNENTNFQIGSDKHIHRIDFLENTLEDIKQQINKQVENKNLEVNELKIERELLIKNNLELKDRLEKLERKDNLIKKIENEKHLNEKKQEKENKTYKYSRSKTPNKSIYNYNTTSKSKEKIHVRTDSGSGWNRNTNITHNTSQNINTKRRVSPQCQSNQRSKNHQRNNNHYNPGITQTIPKSKQNSLNNNHSSFNTSYGNEEHNSVIFERIENLENELKEVKANKYYNRLEEVGKQSDNDMIEKEIWKNRSETLASNYKNKLNKVKSQLEIDKHSYIDQINSVKDYYENLFKNIQNVSIKKLQESEKKVGTLMTENTELKMKLAKVKSLISK